MHDIPKWSNTHLKTLKKMLHLEQVNILGGYGLKGEYDILYTFMSCALEVNSNGRCENMWNLVAQPLRTSYFHDRIVSDHQNWQVNNLIKRLLVIKLQDLLFMWSCKFADHGWQIHSHSVYGHQTCQDASLTLMGY